MNVLAISGSLRAASINSMLLRAAARLARREITVEVRTLGDLALFNPDFEPYAPAPVTAFKNAVAAADALIIASPEYAHGVTGIIKNALDWLVSFEPFVNKPVAVWNASPRAHHAEDALRETLGTMSASIVEDASIRIPLLGSGLDEQGMIEHVDTARTVRAALDALHAFVVRRDAAGPVFPVA